MHRRELQSRPDYFSIYAVCDEIYERCEKFKQECGSQFYKKHKDMLRDPEVEPIDIATRSCDHCKHAKMALGAGKSVLLEKPFCTSVKVASKLIENVKKNSSFKLGGNNGFSRI
ncbi:MAG: Gfo/Idh/MocA family oxidoreductase [Clostridia bacterium]|nr:Gfo/Idh/MocA family oxidoreductase [Clostridia bacterium]